MSRHYRQQHKRARLAAQRQGKVASTRRLEAIAVHLQPRFKCSTCAVTTHLEVRPLSLCTKCRKGRMRKIVARAA